MKFKSLFAVLATAAITTLGLTSTITEVKANQEEVSFICREGYDQATGERLPTTFAWTPRGKVAVLRFKSEDFSASGYTPQRRCEEIAPRFDSAYKNGSIKFITNDMMNDTPVICTARKYRGECDTLLMTLRSQDDPETILIELAQILGGRRTGGTIHSSSDPQYYYKVNIDRFLNTAPVEEE